MIADTGDLLAFLDIMPIARGHVLVIPKKHIELAHEAAPETMGAMMALATRIAAAAKTALRCDGFNFLVNSGSCAGQVVPHVHLHLIPRNEGDGIHWPWPQGTLSGEQAAALVESITRNLA